MGVEAIECNNMYIRGNMDTIILYMYIHNFSIIMYNNIIHVHLHTLLSICIHVQCIVTCTRTKAY